MFGGGTTNPYDDIVNKTTDENLTSENWELILNLCDKVQDEGQEGAHSVIASVLKRLAHRNPNVQLYALSLAESLSKNLGIEVHREIASKAFTQGLERLITDRTTHDKVKRRALGLVATWTADFEKDSTLGVMEDCYNNLKSKNYKFEAPEEAPPPTVDDEIRRKEEEELQRVLEMSMQDKGGRGQWSGYSATSSNVAGGSSSSSGANRNAASTASQPSIATSSSANAFTQPKYQAGYAPARTPSPTPASPKTPHYQPAAASTPTTTTSAATMSSQNNIVTRVRALHTFEPTEPGELAFEKGDVIKVVDRGYKDWWRGQLKGRTGIFPVNYVEPMPEPTSAELAKEAEQEAAVFAQAVNVEKLLNMLRSLDPAKDNLADNEEIQELYRSSMALRPKIVKLIDKYSQKRADLVSMNETFVRARTIFDRMMEESLARHTGVYEQPSFRAQYRPDSRARQEYQQPPGGPGAHAYGWNQPGYDQPGFNFPTPASVYPGQPENAPGYPNQAGTPGPQQFGDPSAAALYAQQQQQLKAAAQAAQAQAQAQAAQAQAQAQAQAAQAQAQAEQAAQAAHAQAQAQQQQQAPQPGAGYPAQSYVGQQPGAPYGPQGPTPYPAQAQQSPQQQMHQAQQQSPQMQSHPQPQTAQTQPAQIDTTSPAQQAQPQASSPPQQQQVGPPYVFNPATTYADPNVQAWAQYYAKGGRDLAGAVYFISIPGVTDTAAAASPQAQPQVQAQPAQQSQPQQQQPQTQPQTQAQMQPSQQTQSSPSQHTSAAALATRNSVGSLPYPGSMASNELAYTNPQGSHSQPQLHDPQAQPAPLSTMNSFSGAPGQSAAGSSVPSWVIPKKTSPPSSTHGSSPGTGGGHNDGAGSGSYLGLQGQFANMNMGDGGSAHHPSPHELA